MLQTQNLYVFCWTIYTAFVCYETSALEVQHGRFSSLESWSRCKVEYFYLGAEENKDLHCTNFKRSNVCVCVRACVRIEW